MSQWCRVYGLSKVPPDPAKLVEHVRGEGLGIAGQFMGSKEEGWTRAELLFAPDGPPVKLERHVAIEPGLGHRFKTWVDYLGDPDSDPIQDRIMAMMLDVEQVFTLDAPDGYPDVELMVAFCLTICRYLAGETQGIYQLDVGDKGLFWPDGRPLLRVD